MKCTDEYFEALEWSAQVGSHFRDNRVGYSIIVDEFSIVAVLALPPSAAEEYCDKLSRRHEKTLQLLDQHFGTWEGAPGVLSEAQVRKEIKAFGRRVCRPMTLAVLNDAQHAKALAIEAEVRGFTWGGLKPEAHIQQFWKNYDLDREEQA